MPQGFSSPPPRQEFSLPLSGVLLSCFNAFFKVNLSPMVLVTCLLGHSRHLGLVAPYSVVCPSIISSLCQVSVPRSCTQKYPASCEAEEHFKCENHLYESNSVAERSYEEDLFIGRLLRHQALQRSHHRSGCLVVGSPARRSAGHESCVTSDR